MKSLNTKYISIFLLISIFLQASFSYIFVGTRYVYAQSSTGSVPIPGLPEDLSQFVDVPYGGMVVASLPCPCSMNALITFNDYRSKMVLPLIVDFIETKAGLGKDPGGLLKNLDPKNMSPIAGYYTPQNFASMLLPGVHHIGFLEGSMGVCLPGAPPLCAPAPLTGINIKSFGNSGLPLVSAATAASIAAPIMAASAAYLGYQMFYPTDENGNIAYDPSAGPGCGATFTDLSYSGDGDSSVMSYFETPGRENWPVKTLGGGGIKYEIVWGGAVSGNEKVKKTNFLTEGVKVATISVSDGTNRVTKVCPPVVVANQSPTTYDPSYQEFNLRCTVNSADALFNQQVTFSAVPVGGKGPYQYNWTGDVSGTTSSITTSFNTPGFKVATVDATDANGNTARRVCKPVTVTARSFNALDNSDITQVEYGADGLYTKLDLTCEVDKQSINPGEFVTYTANISGGKPEEITPVNAEMRINGMKMEWTRAPDQSSKDMKNIFNGYGEFSNRNNWPKCGEMTEMTLVSVDGACQISRSAPWPDC